MRSFTTGATRDTQQNKPSYGGYFSPIAIRRFGEYMLKHEVQADGKRRSPGNWKLGMPTDVYFESLLRHVEDVWLEHDGFKSREGLEDALCAVIFNAQGFLHEILKNKNDKGS